MWNARVLIKRSQIDKNKRQEVIDPATNTDSYGTFEGKKYFQAEVCNLSDVQIFSLILV